MSETSLPENSVPISDVFIGPSESSNVPISEIDKQSILGAKQQEVLPDAGAILPCGSKRKRNANKGDKRTLNQEDIEAVQFLASEFSKEVQAARNIEQKDAIDIETVDSTMLEVASVQGVSEQNLPGTQHLVIDEASVTCQPEYDEDDSGDVGTQSIKRRRSKSDDREFKCGFCSKSFSMKIALDKHLVVHGAELPWQCPDCPKGFMKSSDYKDHCNKEHDNFRPFPCHVCGKALSNLGILKNHQGLHTGERPFQCNVAGCSKAFLTKTNLEDHLRKHINAREFECDVCKKRFNLKGDLRQHEKVHKQERPFECEFCKMSFPRGPSLWRHRRTHTGEKPYTCDICGKRFARMENCQEHRRIHTGERPLACKVCGKTFRDSGNFSNHKKIHEDGYVPRKKRAVTQTKVKPTFENTPYTSATSDVSDTATVKAETSAEETDVMSHEVAFIVAPMQVDDSINSVCMSTTSATTSEQSYVQVGNFLLTMEMEAAFKQLMQQHGGSNEFVTLAMTNGKGLEFVSDPSQVGAIMQAAAIEAQQCLKEGDHDVSQQDLSVAVIASETGTQVQQFAAASSETPLTASETQVETDIAKLPSDPVEELKDPENALHQS